MKCIKQSDGKVLRVKDGTAESLVTNEGAVFIKKAEWKKDNPEHQKRSETQKKIDEKNAKKKEENK